MTIIKKIKRFIQRPINEILFDLDRRMGLAAFEQIMNRNWFNPFFTIWLNLRSFNLRQAVRFPIYVYGRPRIYSLLGKMIVEGDIHPGMIKFNQSRPGGPNLGSCQSELLNEGTIIFQGKGVIGTGNHIVVGIDGTFVLGDGFLVTDFVNVVCYKSIIVGSHSWITHRCQVFDNNFHHIANFRNKIVPDFRKEITIGRGCWICNSTTVTAGALIPDYTIVSSNSLVNKDFSKIPANSIIGGIPAKFISEGYRKIDNQQFQFEIVAYYRNHTTVMELPDNITPDYCSNM